VYKSEKNKQMPTNIRVLNPTFGIPSFSAGGNLIPPARVVT
jgi:hypothetical protein